MACAFTLVAGLLHAAASAEVAAGVADVQVPSLAPMLAKIMPGVVSISVSGQTAIEQVPLFSSPILRRFLDFPEGPRPTQRQFSAVGSGVILDATKGFVLTNAHLLEDADEIIVTLGNGKRLQAKHIGSDPTTDIAVVQIPAVDLQSLPFGDSELLQVGDYVVAIGNPFGLERTVTLGIVSGLGRSGLGIEGYENFIQTDASINPGNSGGALVNLRGELVGINTALLGSDNGNTGIGFAIPLNMARAVAGQLIAHGKIIRGQLGISTTDLAPDSVEAKQAGVSEGALVIDVLPGWPAEEIGLQTGDVVVEINGTAIRNAGSLRNLLGQMPVGAELAVVAMRHGKKRHYTAILIAPKKERAEVPADVTVFAGAVLESVGVVASGVPGVSIALLKKNSKAYLAGLRPGDVIAAVNDIEVVSPREVIAIGRDSAGTLLLQVERGDSVFLLEIRS
ncbi:trypsin-like peptidase domain-containing protein [Dongia sp. agr-C8]